MNLENLYFFLSKFYHKNIFYALGIHLELISMNTHPVKNSEYLIPKIVRYSYFIYDLTLKLKLLLYNFQKYQHF